MFTLVRVAIKGADSECEHGTHHLMVPALHSVRSPDLAALSLKDSLRQKEERIEELEEALRESVQITAEREVVLAHEEQALTHSEKQVPALTRTHVCRLHV